ALAKFGTDDILVNEFAENKTNENDVLTASFWLRMFFGLITFLIATLFLFLTEESSKIQNYIFICSLVFFFQSFEVIDSYNRAKVQIKRSSLARIVQILLSGTLKVYLILSLSDIKWFVATFAFDAISYSLFIYLAHRKKDTGFIFRKVNFEVVKRIIKNSWPIMIVSFCTLVFMKIDQLLIGNLLEQDDVGFYAASQKIIELLSLYPALIMMSLYTAIINVHKKNKLLYQKRFQQLNQVLIWGSIVICVPCSIFSKEIITLLYSNDYIESYETLRILCFNLIFISMSLISLRWYIIEKIQHILVLKTILASIVNIALNLWLITIYGLKCAAIRSLKRYFIFYFLFEAFHPRTRECFKINSAFLKFKKNIS